MHILNRSSEFPLKNLYHMGYRKVKVTQLCPTLCNPMDCPWNSPGQNTGVGSLSLLQGIFPIQGSNPGLPHCWQSLYQLNHQGRTLEWVAYPFSRVSSWPRNQSGVSHIVGGFFTNGAISEALRHLKEYPNNKCQDHCILLMFSSVK